MRSKENRHKLSTKLQEAGFSNHPSFIARIKASRRLKTAPAQPLQALDVQAVDAALSTAERELAVAAAQVDMLGRALAPHAQDPNPAAAPLSPEAFAQLHADKVTAQSMQKAHARGVRSAKREADYARLMLTRALDNFGASARLAEGEALKAAIAYESACSAALTEAHKEHVASMAALHLAQGAYLSALHRAPREALAARTASAGDKAILQAETDKHAGWLDDAALGLLRLTAALDDL